MEPTQEQIAAYIGAVIAAGVAPERLGVLLSVLDSYANKMIAEAQAAIADQEGAAAVQAAEAERQAAQSAAAKANAAYLTKIKAMAAGA